MAGEIILDYLFAGPFDDFNGFFRDLLTPFNVSMSIIAWRRASLRSLSLLGVQ